MFPENLDQFRFFQFGHFFDFPVLNTDNNRVISNCSFCGIKRISDHHQQSYYDESLSIDNWWHGQPLFIIERHSGGETKVINEIITCEEYIIRNIIT